MNSSKHLKRKQVSSETVPSRRGQESKGKTMLQVRLELTTSASLAHLLPYKYRALTDCATGAPASHFRSLVTRPTRERPTCARVGTSRAPQSFLFSRIEANWIPARATRPAGAEGALLAG